MRGLSRYPSEVKKGSILILSLWVLGILSVFVLYLNQGMRVRITLAKRLTYDTLLHSLASSGVKKAIMELKKDNTPSDSLKDNWANNPQVFKDFRLGDGSFTVSYQIRSYKDSEVKTYFGVVDEASKLNINTVDRRTLKRLLEAFGVDEMQAEEIAAAIVDWRDQDSFLSIPIGSAEDSYYTNLDLPYYCKDSPFQVLDELLLVKGMSKELFDKVKDYLTVFGDGKININTATFPVLKALRLKDKLIEKIIRYREGEDEEWGTSDDRVFTQIQMIIPQLTKVYSLSAEEINSLNKLISNHRLTISSSIFLIRSRATLPFSPLGKEITCVVDREGKILFWREL